MRRVMVPEFELGNDEVVIDSFAGGGGASLGIAWALGRSPDLAVNHNAGALQMHERNHPSTTHVVEDVFRAKFREMLKDRRVGLLWASPDCTHFANARGVQPVRKDIRGLAWVVVKWATEFAPRVIILENVREFEQWGPVVPRWKCRDCDWKGTEGQATLVRTRRKCPACESRSLWETDEFVPNPKKKGVTFKQFVGRLKARGYEVRWRVINAADFGAGTHRRRLFLIARNDGRPIVWPEPTHTTPVKSQQPTLFTRLRPYRNASDFIDFNLPIKSIFERERPHAPATLRRIAMGVYRYVLENPKPFLVGWDGASLNLDHSGMAAQFLSRYYGQSVGQPVDCPLPTESGCGHTGLVSPSLIPLTHAGERRPISVEEPFPTITTANRGEIGYMAATLANVGWGERQGQAPRCQSIEQPLGTVVGSGKHGLVSAFCVKHFGGVVGTPIDQPFPTTTARGTQNQLAAVNLVHLNHGEKQWSGVNEPLRTVTSVNHAALVYAFMIRYFGTAIGQHVTEPLYTITGKDRFGLVLVRIHGETFIITDIGMRMLVPRELAGCQGFPSTYILTGSKTEQTKRIGNSVSPYPAAALVAANVPEMCRPGNTWDRMQKELAL